MVSRARTAAQRREQRQRSEARFAGRLCKMVELRHRGFAPSHALVRVVAELMDLRRTVERIVPQEQERISERIGEQTVDYPTQQNDMPQEHISERIMDQAVDAPVPQVMEGIVESESVASASAVTYATPAAGIKDVECVASSPAVAQTAPAPVSECVASTPAVYQAELAPVIEYVASAPAHTNTAPAPVTNRALAPVIENVTAPAVSYAPPAPVIEYVGTPAVSYAAPAPVIEYVTTPAASYAAPAPVTSSPASAYAAPAPVSVYVAPSPAVTSAVPAPVIESSVAPALAPAEARHPANTRACVVTKRRLHNMAARGLRLGGPEFDAELGVCLLLRDSSEEVQGYRCSYWRHA